VELDLARDAVEPPGVPARAQQGVDAVTLPEQAAGQVRADESGRPGDERALQAREGAAESSRSRKSPYWSSPR
jgi:hypothetical protein